METCPLTYRQGDVLVVAISKIPENAKRRLTGNRTGRLVLARGEMTNHDHTVAQRGNDLLQVPSQSDLFLLVKEGDALLEHQEHATITIPPGTYRVIRQREYDPAGERRVAD